MTNLPDCMMPDGGEACIAYHEAVQRIAELDAQAVRHNNYTESLQRENASINKRIAELEAEVFRLAECEEACRRVAEGLITDKSRLEAERDRLRAALQAIADDDVEEWEMAGVAINALEEK